MSTPGAPLQVATVSALKAHEGMVAFFGGDPRVYDSIPTKPVFPYINIGDVETLPDGAGCAAGFECITTVRVFSRPGVPGRTESKMLAGFVYEACLAKLTVAGFRVVEWEFVRETSLKDTDGLTPIVVSQFRYLIDPA